jgi:TPR repeat protein
MRMTMKRKFTGLLAFCGALLLLACSAPKPPVAKKSSGLCPTDVAAECPVGDGVCLRNLGTKSQSGPLRERDYQKAANYWECACEFDDSESCRRLGVLMMRGEGAQPEPERAEELFEDACKDGDGDACAWLGLLWTQTGYKKPEEAIAWIRKGCDMAGAMACGRLGAAYAYGKYVDRQDLPRGKMLLSSSCKQGDGFACRTMGAIARGQEKNEARATEWYEKSCELEDHEGCFELGRSRTERAVGERDLEKGAAAFQEGCLLGSGEACNSLGRMKQTGEGTSQDKEAAAKLFKEACAGGSKGGCANWGMALESGEGTPRDVKAAFEPMSVGCEGNHPGACTWLGVQYASGESTVQDPPRALEHLDKACRLESWLGCRLLLHYAGGGEKWVAAQKEIEGRMESSCDKNDLEACYQVALIRSVASETFDPKADKETLIAEAQRRAEDIALFEKACRGNHQPACLEVGARLAHPLPGVVGNYERALEILVPLCEAKQARACNELGFLHANGKGVKLDREAALTLFEVACEGGESSACERAATGYDKGWGAKKDGTKAKSYLEKACQLGCTECCSK